MEIILKDNNCGIGKLINVKTNRPDCLQRVMEATNNGLAPYICSKTTQKDGMTVKLAHFCEDNIVQSAIQEIQESCRADEFAVITVYK